MMKKFISIIIPARNEERYIGSCLDSILQSTYTTECMEVFVVDGMSEDRTAEIVQTYHEKHPFISLISNPKRIAPVAMNLGIKASRGEAVFIISAHAEYDANYFEVLTEQLFTLDADCVGPVMVTDVKHKTNTSHAIVNVLSDKLGVGSAFRTGVKKIMEVDTVAFGCYRKEVFEKTGVYDERLIRNQDIEMNKRIINHGGKIYIIPQVEATYYARETFGQLAKNNFANGQWNLLTAFYTGTFSSLSLRHFIPLVFLLSLLIPALLALVWTPFLYVSIASAVTYMLATGIRSWMIAEKTTLFYQWWVFIVLHLSYGAGELWGIVSIFRKMISGKKDDI